MSCIFCRIVKGELPSKKVYEDDQMLAFWDVSPKAPVHVLVIPKKHIGSLVELDSSDEELIAHIMLKINHIAQMLDLDNGFRFVSNIGEDSGQSVKHLHFHILGGKKYGESFG